MTKTISITDNKDKTSTMWLVSSILSKQGCKTATIGTSGVRVNNRPFLCYSSYNKTSSYNNINLILLTLKTQDLDYIIIEDNNYKIDYDYKFTDENSQTIIEKLDRKFIESVDEWQIELKRLTDNKCRSCND
jgi:hypothetical protein